MQKLQERVIKEELDQIDLNLFKDKNIVKESVYNLLKSRESIDDFIDTLELLSDDKFKNDLKKALEEYKTGEVIHSNINDLRKHSECDDNE
ncbi:MAG: hypothetical protein KAQ92_07180 [Candidatus Aenigmarchaeota archaeon]|nr:hypothetical protein [Candidatus Aenigmarchaeota archaeon]